MIEGSVNSATGSLPRGSAPLSHGESLRGSTKGNKSSTFAQQLSEEELTRVVNEFNEEKEREIASVEEGNQAG